MDESMMQLLIRVALLKLPYLLIYVIGLIIAAMIFKRHAKASVFAGVAFLMFLVNRLLEIGGKYWTYSHMGSENIIQTIQLIETINIAIDIIAWVLIIIAIYSSKQYAAMCKSET